MKLDTKKLTRYRTQPTKDSEVRYNCPHCGDMNGKLYVNFKKEQWHCFKCSAGGSILNRDVAQVRGEDPCFKQEPKRSFKWLTHPDIRGSGRLYLTRHNINPETAWKWGVRSGKGDTASRLVIPVRDLTSLGGLRTVFRVAHATLPELLPKELQDGARKPLVLSWDEAREPTYVRNSNRTAIIVEGAADALRLAEAALTDFKLWCFTSTVCLWGKHLDEDTTFYLASLFDNFYILLDREEGLTKGGETTAGMEILSKLGAIADGPVGRHSWTNEDKRWDGKLAADPAELSTPCAARILLRALRTTGG